MTTNDNNQVVEQTQEVAAQTPVDINSREDLEKAIGMGGYAPEDLAAAFFKLEYPRFKGLITDLSYNQLFRLCLNLAGGELVPQQNQLVSDKEKTCYYLGNEMINNRVIMRLSAEMEAVDKANKEAELAKTETNNNEGATNGQ